MAKVKTMYVCQQCQAEHVQWAGQCSKCQQWNSLEEITPPVGVGKQAKAQYAGACSQLMTMDQVSLVEASRFTTGLKECDHVLGGGLVLGSVVLIGGDPGVGKSTLMLQVLACVSQSQPAMYVTGEESLQQVAMRSARLRLDATTLHVLAQTQVESICKQRINLNLK